MITLTIPQLILIVATPLIVTIYIASMVRRDSKRVAWMDGYEVGWRERKLSHGQKDGISSAND